MLLTRQVGPRPAHGHPLRKLCWFVLLFCMLGMGLFYTWQPVTAQSAIPPTPDPNISVPNTVILPPVQMHLPLAFGESTLTVECPITSTNAYEATPILGAPRSPNTPPIFDPDLNLTLRGYKVTNALPQLVAINGPTDDDAPQLAHLFRPVRVPAFRAVYQVYDWNWACCPGGTLGQPISEPEVTLVEMEVTPGAALYPPWRQANISRDYVAMVLYAEKFRITLTYTRDDSPAFGYVVHLENVCVDPTLLAFYEEMHSAGRVDLPALRRSDPIGTTFSDTILVSVRDTGSFMDPRSGKDWWQDTVRAILAARADEQADRDR